MTDAFYFYGCIKSGQEQDFGPIGIGGAVVKTMIARDIAAVVSAGPFMLYDSLEKEKTIKDLVTHQFVIEQVMKQWTIVPVKFGTMVESEEQVRAFLHEGYDLLSGELSRMEGKIEIDVVARWELPKVLVTLPRRNAEVLAKQQEVARKGALAGVEEKIALGKAIEQALAAEKARYRQDILHALQQLAADVRLHPPASEDMIFNGSFLLDRRDEAAFAGAVDMLDRDFENMLNFRIVGPLPVYSFATLVLESIDAGEFEQARRLFGLEGEITEKAVRDAYHRLAQRAHPDTNGGRVGDFHLVHTAYQTLKDYVEKGLVHVGLYRWESETV